MKKIAILCSGGVDSSVALSLLKENSNNDLTVFYLKIWLEDELTFLGDCPWRDDLKIIKETCKLLNVQFEIISLQKIYWEKVVEESISMIKKGYTPNPDIFCNSMIKFGSFFDSYHFLFNEIATGHYAKKINTKKWSYLYSVPDKIKDQTYFLSYTPYEKMKKIIFPLEMFNNKKEVRDYAENKNLPAAKRKDSQGICFLGKISFYDFIKYHCGIKKGPLIDYETKKIIGEHEGFWFFTIGQRQGIGLSGGPFYVTAKDHQNNIVYISKKTPGELFNNSLSIMTTHINYLVPEEEQLKINTSYIVKLRHGEKTNLGIVSEIKNNQYFIKLEKSDQGIAAGQFIAFYSFEGKCIGSGMINQKDFF